MYDLIIIGCGPAGLTAAIYGKRLGLNTAIIGKDYGLCSHAYKVENYPGFESIPGLELVQKMTEQTKKLGVEIINDEVTEITKESIKTKSNKTIQARYIILAVGTEHKHLGLSNEPEFLGKGISYCAVCDAAFFKEKTVAVVGGNNAAATSALLLAEHAKKVYMIYRKEKIRAEQAWVNRIKQNEKIEIINNSNVVEISGKNMLEKVKLDTGKELELNGLFIEIGSEPPKLFIEQLGLETDKESYIKVDSTQKTSIDNIYAAGDTTTGSDKLRQIITACSEGAVAAASVYKIIKTGE